MNILLLGSGGREHALAKSLAESTSCNKLYCEPGNPGIFKYADKANINIKIPHSIMDFCKLQRVDLVVIGPEQPLAEGLADILRESNFKVFGPSKNAARLESSKSFAKDFMKKYKIPTASYRTFNIEEKDEAHKYIDAQKTPIVLKADGLAAGKGVLIVETVEEAHRAIDKMFDGLFGDSGKTVVIEEFMKGEEASILAVTDGKEYLTLASSQDHKRAFDGDKGPNTGGMGAYAPAPIVDDVLLKKIQQEIIEPAIKGMIEEGSPFIGCLYAGLMIKDGTAKVVEFNVRFGDPETQVVLTVLKSDFATLLMSAAQGNLDKTTIQSIASEYATTVVLAAEGYPNSYNKGMLINGVGDAEAEGAIVYHAGTDRKNGDLITSGGRVLAVTGRGTSLQESIEKAYRAVDKINFDNKFYRRDIGSKGII